MGKLLWDNVGLERRKESLEHAIRELKLLRAEFWNEVLVPGAVDDINSELEKAGRVADYIELAFLMTHDALDREESCGAHFRSEYQTEEGEALRNDEKYSYVSVWQFAGVNIAPTLHKEELKFDILKPTVRSYK